jgi:hypothetical protein
MAVDDTVLLAALGPYTRRATTTRTHACSAAVVVDWELERRDLLRVRVDLVTVHVETGKEIAARSEHALEVGPEGEVEPLGLEGELWRAWAD